MKNIFVVIILLVMVSCQMKPDKNVSLYFDTDSLMQEQKKLLYERKAQISKKASVKGQTSKGLVKPDSIQAWDQEFQFLEKININKPALRGAYEVKEYNDPSSNLKVREYSGTKEGLEVPFLKLYYLNTPDNLRVIEAEYVEDNPIYHSRRKLKFFFDDFTGTSLIHKYAITGSQKMILKDSVRFEVKGEIEL